MDDSKFTPNYATMLSEFDFDRMVWRTLKTFYDPIKVGKDGRLIRALSGHLVFSLENDQVMLDEAYARFIADKCLEEMLTDREK